jgi:amino acid adenylation domain-containing protein
MEYLLHHLLRRSAESDPDRVAVEDLDRRLTYAELEERSNRFANLLIEAGVGSGDRVGLYLEKSLEAVVAIYGTLKAGAAYVPLDPRAPASRLAYIARDCEIRVAASAPAMSAAWAELRGLGAPLETVVVDETADRVDAGVRVLTARDIDRMDPGTPGVPAVDLDLAYILYTSGSTGSPKGVMLSHLNALTFVRWAVDRFEVARTDRLSNHAPLHFDLSVFDLYAAASAGAAVVLVPPELSVFPVQIRDFIRERELTIWYSVPSILSMLTVRGGLVEGDLPRLRTILFAGEVFPTKYLRRLMELLPHVGFFNLYGPTETNVCTYFPVPRLPEDQTEPVPIGRAIDDVEVFAVDDAGESVAPGEVGELLVRGTSVMRGYWGDAERSARAISRNGLGDDVYRTGDLVRQDAGGDYRLLGRRDHQIKSRGYRIELGDIEAALYAHPGVVEAAVVAVPDPFVTNRIRASVVAHDGVTERDLVRFCSELIPHYMIPEEIELRDSLPQTSTGKVDRQALTTIS